MPARKSDDALMKDIASSAALSNIKRYQNLLETPVNDAERLTIQELLAEEELKSKLQGPKPA